MFVDGQLIADDCFDVGADDCGGFRRCLGIYMDRNVVSPCKVSHTSEMLTKVPFHYLCMEKHQISGAENRFFSFQLDSLNSVVHFAAQVRQ